MYIFLAPNEWGRSSLRTFGLAGLAIGDDYFADWVIQTYGFDADIYLSWWAS